MGKYTKIPKSTFQEIQMDAGVLLNKFNVETPNLQDADIICATTGGINIACTPTYSDMGEDVDNCPLNMKELKHLDSWEVKVSTTSLGTSAELIKLGLGVADITPGEAGTSADKIVPRMSLDQKDFSDIWWVGDKANGGYVAAHIFNALSTSGISLQSTKNGKGQTEIELTGHVSLDAQDVVPVEFYSFDPATE